MGYMIPAETMRCQGFVAKAHAMRPETDRASPAYCKWGLYSGYLVKRGPTITAVMYIRPEHNVVATVMVEAALGSGNST